MNRDRDVIREPTDEDYKWATQGMNKDRDIVKALNGHWHERISSRLCSCGFVPTGFEIIESHISYNNPDFTSDVGKVQLLREMKERDDWSRFLSHIYCSSYRTNECSIEWACWLVLATTGNLRDFAWEWLCNRKENP